MGHQRRTEMKAKLYGYTSVDEKGNLRGCFALTGLVTILEAREFARIWSRKNGLPTRIEYWS
jgi:hypothetical protein